jgi:hypothetical protein
MDWRRGAGIAAALGVFCAASAVNSFVLTGCSAAGPTQTGELGNGTFSYPCDSSTLNCDATGHAAVFPTAIASGAKFRVEFQRLNAKANIESLVPVSKVIIDVAPDGYFTANRTGWGGYAAVNPGGQLVDFSEVRIVKASELWLNAHSGDPLVSDSNDFQTLSVSLGTIQSATYTLTANLHSSTKELLSGEVTFDWKVTDPTVLSITNITGHSATLTGLKAGTTTLTVAGAGVSKSASVQVQ